MSLSGTDNRKRGGHLLFEHSYLPDTVVLRVRTRNFVVSASYLALHSPFFHDLFYGPNATGLGRYELDFDPHTFGDLLDTIYPCYKKTNCCQDCSSSIINRLNLALRLKLRLAVKRFIMENKKSHKELATVVHENNAWDSYSAFFGNYAPKRIAAVKQDMSDNLEPLAITDAFPDSIMVVVRGFTLFVSSSILSLHSTILSEKLNENGMPLKRVKIDMDFQSFGEFLEATTGNFPSEVTAKFLDALITLGAKHLYDFYLLDAKKKIMQLSDQKSNEEASKSALEVLDHYSRLPNISPKDMKYMVTYMSRNDLEAFFSKCSSLSTPMERLLRKSFDESQAAKNFKLYVVDQNGDIHTLYLSKGDATTVLEVKKMMLERIDMPITAQVLLFDGVRMLNHMPLSTAEVQSEVVFELYQDRAGC